ncbi:hypothetical protein DFH07DRAFT_812644 [Mycena maculata]|uniref:Uncharacterized protein n=1 Tax=Mycena maculata TaxID=230809 RepID=A0AAD7NIN6_9AGAR|nr:hypothetical protein DFH07DRAFT_812644 [Mycena maculata]
MFARARKALTPPIPPPDLRRLPIHERPIAVDPQAASPLYNGFIPPEIRNALFAAILAEYTPADPALAYPVSFHRPGYTGPRTINVAFLLTCRRIYLETYHLPPQLASHVFWHAPATGPPGLGARFPDIHGIALETHYFARLAPWQLSLVKEVRLFTQMFWLDQSFPGLCTSGVLPAAVERLKITLRRGDWWWCERNYPFMINPHRGGFLAEYNQDVVREERGEAIPWVEGAWGAALQRLPALKELEMEFETSKSRREELKKIVVRALRWRFPMGERGLLTNNGLGMEFSEWKNEEDTESSCVFTVKWKLAGNK